MIYTENSNKPHGHGVIDPNNFSPFPKNPTIAKFFKEMGLVDELGSGVRNIHKYGKAYFGYEPEIIEEDIFKIIFKVKADNTLQATLQVTLQATPQVDDKIEKLIDFCKIPRTRREMQEFLNIKDREYFREKILNPLIENNTIMLTIPDKPTSPKQKYYSK